MCIFFSPPEIVTIEEVDNIPSYEYTALYELYNATNGRFWDWHNLSDSHIPWHFSAKANPCEDKWEGIECITVGEPPLERTHIRNINLRERNLSGTLPDTIGNFSRLELLNLPRNSISGTIPQSIRGLSQVYRIDLDYNKLSGAIPEIIGSITSLRVLILSKNRLTGTLPSVIGNLHRLAILYVNSNNLRGTLPVTVGNLTKLAYLDVDTNHFTGSIPEAFSNLTRMHFLGLHTNELTGTIPEFLGNMRALQFLYLNNEKFTGTIPSSLGRLQLLSFLHLQDNQLTGTIPSSLGDLPKLQYLYLSNNRLTGTIPDSLGALPQITSMLFQMNRLHGSLYGKFNHSVQQRLTTVQFSNNLFTSTLPEELFRLPKLTTVVMVSNCFRGSLPSTVCQPERLETLVLDGLQSASSCKGFTIPGFNAAADRSRYFSGSVPSCLFNLPHLNTLHLSGNSLSGTLEKDLVISEKLLDLDLSHNYLSGEIPETIQKKVWYNLALSYNRFRGNLHTDMFTEKRNFTFYFSSKFDLLPENATFPSTAEALNLENNRLSGILPQTIKPIVNISVLQGNIFSCAIDKSDLPQHDPDEDTYQCGSNSFNLPYFIWLIVTGVVCLTALALWRWRSQLDAHLKVTETLDLWRQWLAVLTPNSGLPESTTLRLKNIIYVNSLCDAINRVSCVNVLFIALLLLPLYVIISFKYGTHQEQYAYTVSSTFQAGVVPFALQLALLLVFMALVGASFAYYLRFTSKVRDARHAGEKLEMGMTMTDAGEEEQKQSHIRPHATRLERLSVRFAFFVINVTVVLGVNIAFVYIALYKSSVLLIIAQVLLSFFKFLWNTVCSPFFIRWTAHYLSSSENATRKESSTGFFPLQLFVALFNNIAIPCLVVGAVDPSCFYNVIVPAESETSHYVYAECKLYTIVGCVTVVPEIASASFDPPFAYSYQCSSSFITYYAPTFVYMCLVATVVAPLTQLVAQKIHKKLPKDSVLFRVLDFCLPPVLKPVDTQNVVQRNIFKPYFDANLVLVTLLVNFGIMLTFGAVFPPLGIALAVTIFFVAYFAKLKIGRLITSVIAEGKWEYLEIIEAECRGVGSARQLRQSVWMLVCFSCAFYTLFLFDTLGNKVGFRGAAWVLIVVPLFPLFAYCLLRLYYSLSAELGALNTNDLSSNVTEVVDIELHEHKRIPIITAVVENPLRGADSQAIGDDA